MILRLATANQACPIVWSALCGRPGFPRGSAPTDCNGELEFGATTSTWWIQSSQIGQVLYHGRDGHATKPSWYGRLARERPVWSSGFSQPRSVQPEGWTPNLRAPHFVFENASVRRFYKVLGLSWSPGLCSIEHSE